MYQKETKRALRWIASSKKRLKKFPEEVQESILHALRQIQIGISPQNTKHLKSLKGAREIISNHDGNTYRAFYMVSFEEVAVLHVFQKKAKRDKKTPDKEMKLTRQRMKIVQNVHGKHSVEK